MLLNNTAEKRKEEKKGKSEAKHQRYDADVFQKLFHGFLLLFIENFEIMNKLAQRKNGNFAIN